MNAASAESRAAIWHYGKWLHSWVGGPGVVRGPVAGPATPRCSSKSILLKLSPCRGVELAFR